MIFFFGKFIGLVVVLLRVFIVNFVFVCYFELFLIFYKGVLIIKSFNGFVLDLFERKKGI